MNWNEFIEWLNGFDKINTRLAYVDSDVPNEDSRTIEAKVFAIEGITEEMTQQELIKDITDDIGDGSGFEIWIRVMPEVSKNSNNDRWSGYARIAYFPKGL